MRQKLIITFAALSCCIQGCSRTATYVSIPLPNLGEESQRIVRSEIDVFNNQVTVIDSQGISSVVNEFGGSCAGVSGLSGERIECQ